MDAIQQVKSFGKSAVNGVKTHGVKIVVTATALLLGNFFVLPMLSKVMAKIPGINKLNSTWQRVVLGLSAIALGVLAMVKIENPYLKAIGLGIALSGALFIVTPYVNKAVENFRSSASA